MRWLAERTQTPLVALPFVFAAEIGRPQLENLAGDLLSGIPAVEHGGLRMWRPAGSATTSV